MSSKKSRKTLKGKSVANLGLTQKSINEEAIERYNRKFAFSFEFLDRNQGQNFEDWEKDGLLVEMLNTLRDYCGKTMQENFSDKFKIYGEFPKTSKFKKPLHVPEDAQWASLHIMGKPCLAGHVDGNIFYVVFLDKNHEFYPSKKKHT